MTTLLHWLVTLLVVLACVTCIAIQRTPVVREPPLAMAGRRLLIGGWVLLAARCVYLMAEFGALPVPPVSLLAIALLALGGTLVCVARLFADRCTPCADCPYPHHDLKEPMP